MGGFLTDKSKSVINKTGAESLPPLLYPAASKSDRAQMTKLKKTGGIQKIGPRLYSSLPKKDVPTAVKSGWSEIVSRLYPDSILGYRSALEFRPTAEGIIYLVSTTNRIIHYPGLTLQFLRGPRALDDDTVFMGFRTASPARALLENFSTTKTSHQRALSQKEIEEYLEKLLHTKGEKNLNTLRDRARAIAKKFQWEREFQKLDQTIGALLGTRSGAKLKSTLAIARSRGQAYDSSCNEKLEALFSELRANPLSEIQETIQKPEHFKNKAFFEAYFSNYIEGTTFEIQEAEEIIFEKKIPEKRPKDAHDVLGTYRIVSDPNEMKRYPKSVDELEFLLKNRHSLLMQAREDVAPGEYKTLPNRAGGTHFVAPEYVPGTLRKGFEKYQELPPGLARALFIMFLVTEVHPFLDGNGRIARIMINAELYSCGLATIIIPTVYREDYLLALRALSRRNRQGPLIQMLTQAQKFSALDFSVYRKTLSFLENHNWFLEPDEGRLIVSS